MYSPSVSRTGLDMLQTMFIIHLKKITGKVENIPCGLGLIPSVVTSVVGERRGIGGGACRGIT